VAEVFKILGEPSNPSTTNTTLYSVPNTDQKAQAVISVLVIANTTNAALTARVFCVPRGGSAAQSNALFYDFSIAANTTDTALKGLTLRAGDSIVVRASATNLIFTAFGSEIT